MGAPAKPVGSARAYECDEMTLLNKPIAADCEGDLLAQSDFAIECTNADDMAPALDDAPRTEFHTAERPPHEAIRVPAMVGDGAAGGPARRGSNGLAGASAPSSQSASSFSRNLVDTYFRQMGDAPWLTREQESALAKRIESSQRVLLVALQGAANYRANRPLGG